MDRDPEELARERMQKLAELEAEVRSQSRLWQQLTTMLQRRRKKRWARTL